MRTKKKTSADYGQHNVYTYVLPTLMIKLTQKESSSLTNVQHAKKENGVSFFPSFCHDIKEQNKNRQIEESN